jgi:hypothetical protein
MRQMGMAPFRGEGSRRSVFVEVVALSPGRNAAEADVHHSEGENSIEGACSAVTDCCEEVAVFDGKLDVVFGLEGGGLGVRDGRVEQEPMLVRAEDVGTGGVEPSQRNSDAVRVEEHGRWGHCPRCWGGKAR